MKKFFNLKKYKKLQYGGNPVSCAAVLGVLEVINRENLLEHSQQMGTLFEQELNGLKAKHPCVGDVRGVGMLWGLDLVKSRQSREPATDLAARLILKVNLVYYKWIWLFHISFDSPHHQLSIEL